MRESLLDKHDVWCVEILQDFLPAWWLPNHTFLNKAAWYVPAEVGEVLVHVGLAKLKWKGRNETPYQVQGEQRQDELISKLAAAKLVGQDDEKRAQELGSRKSPQSSL